MGVGGGSHRDASRGLCLGSPRQAGRPLGPQAPALEIALGDPNSPSPTQLLMPPRLILCFCWGPGPACRESRDRKMLTSDWPERSPQVSLAAEL
ncbi:hypothetical protein CapIbe_014551 [Capra ibex]